MRVRSFAPGRVNLIGDHTDYTGGYVLPMAIQLGTTVELERGGAVVELRSDQAAEMARVPLDVGDPRVCSPDWAAYVAGVVAVIAPSTGGIGTVSSTLPIGAGLSSSASLELATALALGFEGDTLALALACQQAEQLASGVPCGVMDQFASAHGRQGEALLLDCGSLEATPVPVPDEVEVVAVHCGEPRRLAGSAYAERTAGCRRAEELIGPLREADLEQVERLADPTLRSRARHVVTENARVLEFSSAMARGDYAAAGRAMHRSHRSLAQDFEVSTDALDRLAARLQETPGVFGARLTGAGFGGCVVALTEPGVLDEGWRLQAVQGAHCGEVS